MSIKKLFFISFFIFLAGIIFGAIFAQKFPLETQKLLEEIFKNFSFLSSRSLISQIIFIFRFNLFRAFLVFISGFLFFLFPFFAPFFNGYLLGMILAIFPLSVSKLIISILPHGIFELPALFLSSSLGAKAGSLILKKILKKQVVLTREIKSLFIIFLKTVPALLFFAAILEILVSKSIIEILK